MVARKTSTLPTRIYSYYAKPPTSGGERVDELLRLGARYYNALIGIERERLREYRETRKFYAPEIEELEQALLDARASLSASECATWACAAGRAPRR